MHIRRVVTGQTETGKSVFISDERVEPAAPRLLAGAEFHEIWGSDTPVALPTGGAEPPTAQYFPPPDGFRFRVFTLGPAAAAPPPDLDVPTALREVEELLP